MIKSFLVLALAGTMTFGTGLNAYARNDNSKFTNGSTTTAESDIDSFFIIKDYDSLAPTGDSAPKSNSPAETFTYTITPYAVWNAGSTYDATTGKATKIDTTNMPMLTGGTLSNNGRTLTVTQNVAVGDAKYEETPDTDNETDKNVEITLPTYATVGDYWYQVVETLGTTTGVLYGTNSVNTATNTASENGGHSRIYYIHVQVTENNTTVGQSTLVKNVTMHKSAPETTLNNTQYNAKANTGDTGLYNPTNKVNAIENRYYAGDLVIKKEVTGNAGDKSKYFKVTVTFEKPSGTIVNSDIPFTAIAYDNTNKYTSTDYIIKGQKSSADTTGKTVINWQIDTNDNTQTETDRKRTTATCEFYVKDSDTVTFSNIPYGINYSIVEAEPADEKYENKIEFTASKDSAVTFDAQPLQTDNDENSNKLSNKFTKTAVGSISDARDEVTITNQKNLAIDIGVILSNAPFIALLAVAGSALAVLIRRRRKTAVED